MAPSFALAASIVLLAGAALFYVGMGLLHNNWTDVGVYSVTVTLLAFGAFGYVAARTAPVAEE